MKINLYNFLVTKVYVWFMTHVEGHDDEAAATAEIEAFEPQVQSELADVLGTQVAGLVTSTNITLASVNSQIAPSLPGLISTAVSKLGVPSAAVPQVTAWANAIVPDLIADAFNTAAAKLGG